MDVGLESFGPNGRDGLGQLRRLPDPHAVVFRRAIGVQQGRRLVLDDPVGEELDGVEREVGVVQGPHLLARRKHLLKRTREVPRVGDQGDVHANLEQSATCRLDVDLVVVQFGPGLLGPGDPEGREHVQGGGQCIQAHFEGRGRAGRGHQVQGAPFAQHAQRLAVGTPRDFAHLRFGGVLGDRGPAQGLRVAPKRVAVPAAQDHGAVGNALIEPAGVEQAAFGERAVVGDALDPFLVGVFLGVAPDLGDDCFHRGEPDELGAVIFKAAVDRVGVALAEPRHEEAAVEVDCLVVDVLGLLHRVGAQCGDQAVADEQGVRVAQPLSGPHGSSVKQGGSLLLRVHANPFQGQAT